MRITELRCVIVGTIPTLAFATNPAVDGPLQITLLTILSTTGSANQLSRRYGGKSSLTQVEKQPGGSEIRRNGCSLTYVNGMCCRK